ncbi:hypothetical protein FNV43_RR12115 [Rhamnella rubrinervis]|uniref:SWI/SNF complex subunit SWI3B n=1 Tax=Rhamnella rubrinervis TaxID=2594499 RepID=A0A8K0H747_9ROSA|nr:hypothetical protein FNV43_RR12115 [Rhamnella rubrinervis]
MVTKSTVQETSSEPPSSPTPVKPETPVTGTESRDAATATATAKPTVAPNPPNYQSDVNVPSYSEWFCWDKIHQCEVRFLPEFFESRSPSKVPRVYMYYRNSIIKHYRADPSRKISFTDVRKALVGDVGSIRRVFDFLEAWGLINYFPSALNKPLKWDDNKDSKAASNIAASPSNSISKDDSTSKRNCNCNHCKSICSIACFVCDKYDMTLCARCYVRGNYQVGVTSSDFRRVEINEDSKSDWLDKDTLHLFEALMHYGDDWRKVAQHVGRSEKDCVSHFIKLPFGEEFVGSTDIGDVDAKYKQTKDAGDAECGLGSCVTSSSNKRMRLTPLADASNPIMAQAAFLSALAGAEVAENAARAAVTTLSQVDYRSSIGSFGPQARNARRHEADAVSNGNTNLNAAEGTWVDANSQLEKEELDVERAISGITQVQMKEIQDKIVRFEAMDLQMEKEWQQLEQMKNMLFVDQLTLLFNKSSAQKTG